MGRGKLAPGGEGVRPGKLAPGKGCGPVGLARGERMRPRKLAPGKGCGPVELAPGERDAAVSATALAGCGRGRDGRECGK